MTKWGYLPKWSRYGILSSMNIPSESQALHRVAEVLSEVLALPNGRAAERFGHVARPDAVLEAGPYTFAVAWKGSGALGPVGTAAGQAKHFAAQLGDSVIPLVAVPFMGEAGQSYCDQVIVAWLDLSGNARILAPGLRIHVTGQRNQFIRRGRPESAFAPKASRVARYLLMHPKRTVSQREIALASGVDEGYTSRVVKKLVGEGLVVRDEGGILARNPDQLLDAWIEDYRFDRHTIIQGHVASGTGDEVVHRLSRSLTEQQVPHAVTGLGAAWLLTHQAGFRLATVYLAETPSPNLMGKLAFREEPRGANTWLVIPNDEGIFHGAFQRDGVRCVHPVQALSRPESTAGTGWRGGN